MSKNLNWVNQSFKRFKSSSRPWRLHLVIRLESSPKWQRKLRLYRRRMLSSRRKLRSLARLLPRLSLSKKSSLSSNNSLKSAPLNSIKSPPNTRKSRPSVRSFSTSLKTWRVKLEYIVVSDPSLRENWPILQKISSVTRRQMRCQWLLDKETELRITTSMQSLIKNQRKIKSSKIVNAWSKVQ